LRRDRRGLSEYFKDPAGYAQLVNAAMLERLRAEVPKNVADKSRNVGVRHYRKILFLNPDDDGARAALERLGERTAEAGDRARPAEPARRAAFAPAADPNADYRVILEAIDREVETPDTFALKLSIRLKSPVTRMRQLVSRAPCVVAQRLPYKKARWLGKVIEELGGTARLEVVVDAVPVVEEKAVPAASTAIAKPLERRTASGGILCPRCGWEEEPDARFCSLCLQHFNKTDKIDAPNFTTRPGFDNPEENPHSDGEGKTTLAPAPARPQYPLPALVIAGVIAVGIVAVLLLAR
jgi:hypothetical protein